MNLGDIVIRESAGEYESLTLALRAVASAAGADLDYDDLCGALGVSWSAVSSVSERTPGWWLAFGRDVFLEPAGRLFGIELRALQPPGVAVDMTSAEAFPQHYEDSYAPLIRRALENDQPVLAWQGWPEFRWAFWGVITGESNDRFEGTTLWADGQRLPLVAPAMQCYVVERCDPFAPSRSELFATAIRHGEAYMNRAPFSPIAEGLASASLITGPAAFDAWETWLQAGEFGNPAEDMSWNEHRQHAEFIASSRLSAVRFLKRHRSVAPDDLQSAIDEAITWCESLANRLADSRDEQKVRSLFADRRGRRKLLETVHAAEGDDRRLAVQMEQLT